MIEICALSDVDNDALEMLLDASFGPDRKSRTAYLLRAGLKPIARLSFGIISAQTLIGSIQCWPVQVDANDGTSSPLVLVGPVAISPEHQNQGFGQMLMNVMTKEASRLAAPPMVMIGDPDYYARFGFTADPARAWRLPGPFEPQRLLLRNADAIILPREGILKPSICN
jgi:predicted N-acetyltransferase YhbS